MSLFDMFRRPKPKPEDGGSPADKQRQVVVANSDNWHLGQTLLDDFVVEQVLGEGGMGKVYLVKSRTTNMPFAVKRAKGLSERERRNFLAELQTWIDLPEHPNLVPCRFFRTVGDEVLIFAEYVGGGSLKNWIDSRKLYEGGPEKTLERILDTAIQFAWGLQCLHELGLVHQDVKPANAMMDKDAQVAVKGLKVRVTDYGLARARAVGREQYVPELGKSILVSAGGYTPAYCSPEQVGGRRLDRTTDVWSFGVSVLEMFQGGVTWQSGRAAAEVLEAFLEHNGEEEHIPVMPEGVAELLKGCFRKDPAQRWNSMDAIVQHLRDVYRSAVGTEYRRVLDKIGQQTATHCAAFERRTHSAGSWGDPREWLERALRAEGGDPAEAMKIVARHSSSRLGQLVGDAAALDEARRMYERLVNGGRTDLQDDLARLCGEAASVHETADDFSGALALYGRAIEIRERLVNLRGRRDLADVLALLYSNKARVLGKIRDERSAVPLYDKAIEIFERLVNDEGRGDLASFLAGAYSDKAIAVQRLGDNDAAIGLYDRSIEVAERMLNLNNWREVAGLAIVYNNKAMVLVEHLADNRNALTLYDRAIEVLERHVNVESRREIANYLANVYSNKAIAVENLGDSCAAIALYDQALKLREHLVNVDGRREFANDLAMAYSNKATVVMKLGDNQSAVCLCDLAIGIRERLVNVEGRRDLADDLATAYSNKATAVRKLGDNVGAVALYDRAIAIRERLVNEGRRELAKDLAPLYFEKANAVCRASDPRVPLGLYERALEIREPLASAERRREQANKLLAMALHDKAKSMPN